MAREEDLSVVLKVDDADVDKLDEATTKVDALEGKTVTIPVESTGTSEATTAIEGVGSAVEDTVARARAKFPDMFSDIDKLRTEYDTATGAIKSSSQDAADSMAKPGAAAKQSGGQISNMAGNAIQDLAQVAGATGPVGQAIGGLGQKAIDVVSSFGGLAAATGIGAVVGGAFLGMQKAAERAKQAATDLKDAILDLGKVSDAEVLSTFNRIVMDTFKSGGDLKQVLHDMAEEQPANAARLLETMDATQGYSKAADTLRQDIANADAEERQNIKTKEDYKSATDNAKDSTETLSQKTDDQTTKMERSKERVDELRGAYDLFKGSLNFEQASLNFQDAMQKAQLSVATGTALSKQDILDLKSNYLTVAQDIGLNPVQIQSDLKKLDQGDINGVYFTTQQALDAHSPAVIDVEARIRRDKLIAQLQNAGLVPAGSATGKAAVSSSSGRAAGAQTININLPRGSHAGDISRAMSAHTRRSGQRYGRPVVTYARR